MKEDASQESTVLPESSQLDHKAQINPESIGVFLIHGFTGSPYEFSPLTPYLEDLGYKTHLVTLPAHGDFPDKHLADVSINDLLNHCASEYVRFSSTVNSVYIVGHSLGGVCSLLTASLQPEKLAGIVVFATPFEHAYTLNYTHGMLKEPFQKIVQGIRLALKDRIPFQRPVFAPWDMPKLMREGDQLFTVLKRNIQNIRVPVILTHSKIDMTVPYEEMEKLKIALTPHCPVTAITLKQNGHGIFPASQDISEALEIIIQFITTGDITQNTQVH
ncbi:MAG: alpha/beta fold hydrolase [Cyanobacteria bacterium P01_H01_bin.74]